LPSVDPFRRVGHGRVVRHRHGRVSRTLRPDQTLTGFERRTHDMQMPSDLIGPAKAAAALLIVTSLALGLRYLAFRALRRWASQTASRTDDILLESLSVPSFV